MAACPGLYQLPLYIQSRQVDSAVTRVCHCVLIWVLNISQDGRDEQGRKQRTRISITEPYYDAPE